MLKSAEDGCLFFFGDADAGVANGEEKLDFIDSIDDKSLDILYATCSALVYPSRMEGFGLPPLEAMAHAKPVIVSDIPVMRELLGAVPLYVPCW